MGPTKFAECRSRAGYKANHEWINDESILPASEKWMPVGMVLMVKLCGSIFGISVYCPKGPSYLRIRLGRLAYDYN